MFYITRSSRFIYALIRLVAVVVWSSNGRSQVIEDTESCMKPPSSWKPDNGDDGIYCTEINGQRIADVVPRTSVLKRQPWRMNESGIQYKKGNVGIGYSRGIDFECWCKAAN